MLQFKEPTDIAENVATKLTAFQINVYRLIRECGNIARIARNSRVSRGTLYGIRNHKAGGTLEVALRIAEIFDTTLDELCTPYVDPKHAKKVSSRGRREGQSGDETGRASI